MINKVFLLLIALAVFLNLAGCKKEKTDIFYNRDYIKQIKELRSEAAIYMATNKIPGCSFAVAKDGKLIYSEGMGYASKDLDVQATRKTKFRIGKVSECFTAVMYQMMLANGTLHADSTVQHYLPDFPEKNYKITINNLAYQTSGLREPTDQEVDYSALNNSIIEGINHFKNDTLIFSPGDWQIQSMFNYNLLGAVMEKASGTTFAQLLKSYITDTLHLNNTETDVFYSVIKGRSNFFEVNYIGQPVQCSSRDMRFKAPSEGLLSNAEDLVLFGNAILESKLISEEMKTNLFKPAVLSDSKPSALSQGWIMLTGKDGTKLYGRAGVITGGSAALVIFPHEKLVIAVTTNLSDKLAEIPILDFANKFIDTPTENKAERK